MLVRTKEEDGEIKRGLGGLQGSGWASFLLLPFFLSSLLLLLPPNFRKKKGGREGEWCRKIAKHVSNIKILKALIYLKQEFSQTIK
jgi:hypothetical protein